MFFRFRPSWWGKQGSRLGAIGLALGTMSVLLGACSPIAALNALTPHDTYRLRADVPYGAQARQRLDLYVPTRVGVAPWPVVVFFYGGRWNSGERAEYRFVGEALASNGILAVVADYRVSPQVRYPDFVRDSAAAVDWTLRHVAAEGGDPARVFVMGHSAGAYNAAMVALDARWLGEWNDQPTQLAGWIGLAGPYDFLPIIDPVVQGAFSFPGTPTDSQPLRHTTTQLPTLLLAAEKDSIVDPQRNSVRLAQALQEAGAPVILKLYPRINHPLLIGVMARPLRWLAPVLPTVVEFVQHTPPAGSAGSVVDNLP